ncbi:iron ABC transporter permease [Virgibacillus dokdonensis]|uniref:Iron ABC transporter permease n=1 Tax=Virgibacillus dokdonensis TaxID=302167 RepID=A0ABU7VI98_9BACI
MSVQKRSMRRKYITIITPLLLILVTLYGISYGPISISLTEIWTALFTEENTMQKKIIMDIRLPRVLIGLLTGACLAASGAVLQGVMKNPLADPGIIGVSSGAGLAAIITMVLLPQFINLLPIAAFIGALFTSLLIYLLAWDRGASPVKIILAGVAINALLGAIMSGIMVLYSDRVQAVLPWLSGGLTGKGWYQLEFMAPYALFALLLSVLAIKPANVLLLGDDSAKLLGEHVEVQRFLLITLASLLAGVAVSVAGLVGFVGLVIPHVIRLLIGDDYIFLLPLSIISGAILVVLADTIARSWFDPIEIPVGILLACLGAPFFLYLLKKRRIL